MALSFISNIPVSDSLRIDTTSYIYKVFRKATRLNKSATNKILADLFCSLGKDNDIQRCFATTCGELKYIGVKPASRQYIVARLSRQILWVELMNHILPVDDCSYATIPSNTG